MGRIVINNFKDGGPMRIQNSQGNIVTVPDSHKRIIKKHIKDGNHHMVSALVNKYSNPEGMSDGQQYALGGGLQGAMSGVSAGAAFGPWGAAIGGVIGGVGGWLGEDSQKKAQAQQLASQQQMMQQQNLFPRDQNLYNPNYQNGGRIKRSSYPQEGLINQIPGGNMINMGQGSELAIGASHAQGGMQISSQAEIQGKEVLLDDQYVLTAEKGTDGKSSIAEVFTKNKGALSPRNDKSTKELGTNMLKQYAMQKNQDYLDQRNAKLHKAMQRTMMKYGGHINKYTHGTGFESVDENLNNQFDWNISRESGVPMFPQDNTAENWQRNKNSEMMDMYNNQDHSVTPVFNPNDGSVKVDDLSPNENRYGSQSLLKSPSKFGEYASLTGTLAPAAYNLIRGITDKPEKYNPNDYMNSEFKPSYIPENTGQNEIRDAYSRGYYDLKNSGAYSKLGQTALMGSRAKNDYERKLRLASENAGIGNQAGQFNANIRDRNLRMKLDLNQFNAANRAQKRNFISQGITDVGGAAGQFYQNKQMDKRQNEYFDIMDQVYGQTVPGYKSPRKNKK